MAIQGSRLPRQIQEFAGQDTVLAFSGGAGSSAPCLAARLLSYTPLVPGCLQRLGISHLPLQHRAKVICQLKASLPRPALPMPHHFKTLHLVIRIRGNPGFFQGNVHLLLGRVHPCQVRQQQSPF